MKITFIGSGSAFNKNHGQSNMIVESDEGKKMLIDCGSTCWTTARSTVPNLKYGDIDAVYVSHLHADHVGGLEELAFCRYFVPNSVRPKLFCVNDLMTELWERSLRGGLESIQGKTASLTEYFDCHRLMGDMQFQWEGITFQPVQTVHVMSGYTIKYSFGLLITVPKRRFSSATKKANVFITTDVQFCPNQIVDFYKQADVIMQDCETTPFKSGVHAHYDELKTLDESIKKNMFLYHYQTTEGRDPESDGFAGFVKPGQVFEFTE